MALDIKPWDTAEILTDEETIAFYLEEAFEEGDPVYIAKAINTVARARKMNMSSLAREADISRDTLYRAFSENGNPTLSTLLAVTKALGYQLTIKKAS